MVIAGILAGGIGSRMGSAVPKQFLEVGGKPVIVRTVETFVNTGLFDMIYIAVAGEWLDYAHELIEKYIPFGDNMRMIPGGRDRTGSILEVIRAAREFAGDPDSGSAQDAENDWLLVTHDAARPFVTEKMIKDSINIAEWTGCAGTAIPAQDTIFISSDGENIDTIPPRNTMYQMQTPQTFRIGLFLKALKTLSEGQRAVVTDACGVFRRAGMRTGFVKGDRRNIKITEPIDLVIAEKIAKDAGK